MKAPYVRTSSHCRSVGIAVRRVPTVGILADAGMHVSVYVQLVAGTPASRAPAGGRDIDAAHKQTVGIKIAQYNTE